MPLRKRMSITMVAAGIVLATGAFNISAENSTWTMAGGDLSNSRFAKNAVLKPPLSLVWKAKVGSVETSPVVAENKIVVATGAFGSGRIYLIDFDAGAILKSGSPYVFWLPGISSPVLHNGKVYLGVAGHGRAPDIKRGIIAYAFGAEPAGETVSMFFSPPDSWPVFGAPKVYQDKLYFMAGDFAVYGVDLKGTQIWRYQTRLPAAHERPAGLPDSVVESSPAIADGVVYIGSRDGSVYALDAKEGKLQWEFPTGGPVDSSPAVAEKRLVVGSRDGNIYCLDKESGKKRWRVKTGGWVSSSPAVDPENKRVYAGSYDGNLYAVNLDTGRVLWKFKTDGWVLSSPLVANGVVYFGSFDQNLYAVDADTGKELWKFQTDNAVVASPIAVRDRLLMGSCDGYLYCFGPQGAPWVEPPKPAPAKQDELTVYFEKLKGMDAFEIAEVMGSWLEKNDFYEKPNKELPEDYVRRRRGVETLLYRGQQGLVGGEWSAHELKVALLYAGKETDAERIALQHQFNEGLTNYLSLWNKYLNLKKIEKDNPEETATILTDLEKRLPSSVEALHTVMTQAQQKLKPLIGNAMIGSNPQHKFFYSTQTGVDTSWLWPKIQMPHWTVFISGITAKFGVEAHRTGGAKLYEETGVGYKYSVTHPEWTRGMSGDGRSPQDLCLDVKTGNYLEGPQRQRHIEYVMGSYFTDEGIRQRYREHTIKEALRCRNAPGFYAYDFGNEIHFGVPSKESEGIINGYGPWAEALFRDRLKARYATISRLNAAWGSHFDSFNRITLPAKLPQTPQEHALWEDWAVLREDAMAEAHKTFYEAVHSVDRKHPVMDRYLVWVGWSPWAPLLGWNHYKLAKHVDYVGTHAWYSLHWLNFSNDKRFYDTEWTPFFSRGLSLREIQQMTRHRMNDWCAQGQVGWQFFCWVDLTTYARKDPGIGHYGPLRGFIRYDGLPNVMAFEAGQFIERARRFEEVIAGGTESRLQAGFLWSQVNFRHDLKQVSYDDSSGWYHMLNSIHIGMKVVFDEQLQETKTDLSGYAVIIVPWIDSLDPGVSRQLMEYVRKGGKLLVTGTGARYTGYGKENRILSQAAGVVPLPETVAKENISIRYRDKETGLTVSRPPLKLKEVFTYQALDPRKTTMEGFWGDKPVIARSLVGKGEMLFVGIPIGIQHISSTTRNDQRSPSGESFLSELLASFGVKSSFVTDSKDVTARFWQYQSREYLFLVNNGPEGKIQFSIEGLDRMIDLLNGQNVPAIKDSHGGTWFTTDLLYGEGRVFSLEK